MKIMALDVGTKRVGVATSDELGITTNPKGAFEYNTQKDLIEEIKKRIEEFEVTSVVIGLPINMNGSIGEAAKHILELASILKKEVRLPIHAFDERLSTVMAENLLKSADLSRKKRKKIIDATSAQIILQDYLLTLKGRDEK